MLEKLKQEQNIDHEAFNYVDNITGNLANLRYICFFALPSDFLLFNMMRACVGITNVRDLWFFEERLLSYS